MNQQLLKTIITTENLDQLASLVKDYLSLGWVVYKDISDCSIELSFPKVGEANLQFYPSGLMKTYCKVKRDGAKHGIFISFYESGHRHKEKCFNNGLQHGNFSVWNESGSLIQKGEYKNGQEDGLWIDYFFNGKKRYEGLWKSGDKNGLFQWWYANDILKQKGKFNLGNKTGKWASWYNTGEKKELEEIGKLSTEYDVVCIEDIAYFGMDFRSNYSVPGKPPFQPTVARYTDNYFIIISSSKVFSYAGQRVGFTVISPELSKKRYPYLKKYTNTEILGHAFVHGGIYPSTAGVPQSTQHGLAAILESVCVGTYNFLEKMHLYKDKSKKAKKNFLSNGFDLVYNDDLGNEISDGFYFTIRWKNLSGNKLLHNMLLFGLAGIPLSITGSSQEGIRICVSLLKEGQFCELKKRVSDLANYLL